MNAPYANRCVQVWTLALASVLVWTYFAHGISAQAASDTGVVALDEPLKSLIAESLTGSRAALDTLAKSNDRRAAPILITLIAREQDPKLQEQAYWTLVALKDPRARVVFLQGLDSSNAGVRAASAWGLVDTATKADVPRLAAMLSASDAQLREAAIWALGNLGDPDTIEPLLALTGDPKPALREAAAVALERLGEPLGRLLVQSIKGDSQARAELAKRNDPRALEPLIRLVADADGPTRRAAAASLGYLRSEAADAALIRMVGRWNWLDRSAASRALFAAGHRPLIDDLRVAARLAILPSTLGYLALLGLLLTIVARLLRR